MKGRAATLGVVAAALLAAVFWMHSTAHSTATAPSRPMSGSSPAVLSPSVPPATPAYTESPQADDLDATTPSDLCGAPDNPMRYNFCSDGSEIYDPDPGTCDYLDCIDNFDNGTGYLVECSDGMYSMSGGNNGACSNHGGEGRTLYGP